MFLTMTASGLASRFLRRRKPVHRPVVRGAHGQVETAQALDAEDAPDRQEARGRLQGIGLSLDGAIHVLKPDAGPAHGAGVGLSVEAAVAGVVELGQAIGTHGEPGHGGVRPVVGDAADDRPARSAIGAVGEGVTTSPIGRVQNLAQAVSTGGHIWGNQGARAGGVDRFFDLEVTRSRVRFHRFGMNRNDVRQRRRLGFQH